MRVYPLPSRRPSPGPDAKPRCYRDPSTTFWGWNDVWLSDDFRSWNIEDRLPAITAPMLLIQGSADNNYGTVAQLEAVEAGVQGAVSRLQVEGASHAPHLDAPELVIAAIADFIASVLRESSPALATRTHPAP